MEEKLNAHVWAQLEVTNPASDILVVRVIEMTIEDFLRKCERALEPVVRSEVEYSQFKRRKIPVADDGKIVLDSLIVDIGGRLKKGYMNFGVANSFGNASHALRKALDRAPCLGRAVGKVEHR